MSIPNRRSESGGGVVRSMPESSSSSLSLASASASGSSPLSESFIRAIFLLLGVGMLIPWNAFVSAKSYFQARLCSSDGNDVVDFELWIGLVWNLSSICSLGLIIVGQSINDYCKQQRQRRRGGGGANGSSTHTQIDSSGIPLNPESEHGNNNNHHDNDDEEEDEEEDGRHKKGHSFWLVMLPLGVFMGVFIATDLLVLVLNINPQTFLIITFIGLALCGTCGAIATAGIVSTAGLFPSHVGINPFFSGQALGGVAVSAANFMAATLENPDIFWEQSCQQNNNDDDNDGNNNNNINNNNININIDANNERIESLVLYGENGCVPYKYYDWAVFAYFLIGSIVLACCLLGYWTIHRHQQQNMLRDDYEVVRDNVPEPEEASPRIGLELKDRLSERQIENNESESYQRKIPATSTNTNGSTSINTNATTSIMEASDPLADPSSQISTGGQPEEEATDTLEEYTNEENVMGVFWTIKGPAVCIFLTFTVTLSLFPSWISKLRSSHACQNHHRITNDLYVPFAFIVFNIGDLVGRIVSEKVPVDRIPNMSMKLFLASVGRVLFYPLLLLCVSDATKDHFLVIESDFYSLLVQFGFAFTNGILISCSFMHGNHLMARATELQERASELLTFAVFLGLLGGSMLSFPLSQLISRL